MLNRYTTGPFHHCISTECLNENYFTMTCYFWQVFFYLFFNNPKITSMLSAPFDV